MSKKKKKNIKSKSKLVKKIDYKKEILILLTFFVIAGVIISTIVNSSNINNKKEQNGVEMMELRDFIEIDVDKVVEKINNKETFLVYVGYPGCQACEKYNPILKRVQTQNYNDTFYLNYITINKKSKNWTKFTNSIDIKQKMTISEDDKEKTIDDTIGNIMKKYGYTPVTIYFINGKCLNAHIGTMSSTEIEKFLGI